MKLPKRYIEAIKQRDTHTFYTSSLWLKVRAEALERDNYECQMCKLRGEYARADTVHHIKHLKDRIDLGLTLSNLISLCFDCHNLEHPEKVEAMNKNNKRKGFYVEERW